MKVFVENMLSAAISSSVTILLILLARGAFRRRLRPAAYILLWGALFLRLMLPVRLELPAQESGEMIAELQRLSEAAVSFSASPTAETNPVRTENGLSDAQTSPQRTGRALSGYEIAGICYFSVAGLLLAGLCAGNVRWLKRVDSAPEVDAGELLDGCCTAMGIKKPKAVLADHRDGIGVAGVFKKRILLDETWFSLPRPRKRAALMHEAAHIRRRHMELLLLSRLLCAVYWFNPLVWVAMRLFREDMETAADYAALQRLSVSDTEYAEFLLQMARAGGGRKTAFLLSAAADKRRLKKRIKAILNFDGAKKTVTAVCLVFAAAAVAAGCAAGAYPKGEAPEPTMREVAACSDAKESVSQTLLETAAQKLGVTYDEIVDVANADLEGDGTEENFIYYARGSQGAYTESGFGLAVIGADETTVLEDFQADCLYGYPSGQVLLLAGEDGVKAAVLCADLGSTMNEKIYDVFLRENGEWKEIFSEYCGGYPYTTIMLDGPEAEVRWQDTSGAEKISVLDAQADMENGYVLGYFAIDGMLTEEGRKHADQIAAYGFDRMEAGLSGDDILLRGYQKITGFHKLDGLGEFVTEWRYRGGAWEITGKTVSAAEENNGGDTEGGFPYSVRWTGSELDVCAGGMAIARLTEKRIKEIYGEETYEEAMLDAEPWEIRGDAVSGFVLQEQEDGRTAVFVKTYLWGAGSHASCMGYGVTKLLMNADGDWDVSYCFMLDE